MFPRNFGARYRGQALEPCENFSREPRQRVTTNETIKITKNHDGKLVALFDEDQAQLSQWLRIRELDAGEIMTAHLDAQASQPLTLGITSLIAAVYKAQGVSPTRTRSASSCT